MSLILIRVVAAVLFVVGRKPAYHEAHSAGCQTIFFAEQPHIVDLYDFAGGRNYDVVSRLRLRPLELYRGIGVPAVYAIHYPLARCFIAPRGLYACTCALFVAWVVFICLAYPRRHPDLTHGDPFIVSQKQSHTFLAVLLVL